jgi:type I restriction enzyme S subunit
MGNILDGQLVLDDLKYLPTNHSEFPKLLLKPGDLLFNRTNSAELVGKAAVYAGQPSPCSFASYLIRVRFAEGVEPKYVAYYINSPAGRTWIRSVVSQQVGQANVNGTKLKSLALPLPPTCEQRRIVDEVDRRIATLDHLNQTLITRERLTSGLRQAILAKAFKGALMRQDPSDEPADRVLARIRSMCAQEEGRVRRSAAAKRRQATHG